MYYRKVASLNRVESMIFSLFFDELETTFFQSFVTGIWFFDIFWVENRRIINLNVLSQICNLHFPEFQYRLGCVKTPPHFGLNKGRKFQVTNYSRK